MVFPIIINADCKPTFIVDAWRGIALCGPNADTKD